MSINKFEIFLFDLDGTLVDTAEDLFWVLNQLLLENKLTPVSFDKFKPTVSYGALAMINLGFGDIDKINMTNLHKRFLELYQQNICLKSSLFVGINEILRKVKIWGIVTNKSEILTYTLLEKLNLKPNVVVCGDTLTKSKPNPEPLLYACDKLQITTDKCIFIGDDKNDVIAAKAANILSVAVTYGYGNNPESWNADFIINKPMELEKWIL